MKSTGIAKEQRLANFKSALKAMTLAQTPNVDAIYLAGCLAAEEERWTDAADYFEKIRNLPLSREMRQKIDGNLVALATQGIATGLEAKEYEPVVNSAKAAALRLRRIRLTPDQRANLVSVFETLGLGGEAEKMEAKIAQSGNFPSGMFGGRGMRPMAAPKERIKELVDSGKLDAATRLLVQEFRGHARQSLDLDMMDNSDYEIRELGSKIKSLGLLDEFFKQLEPGESVSSSKLSTYAVAQEYLGDEQTAIEVYRKILQNNQKQDGVRIRLLLLESPTREDAFQFHFEKFQKRNKSLVGSFLVRQLFTDNIDAEKSLTILQQVAEYVDTIEQDSDVELAFLENAILRCSDRHALDRNRYEVIQSSYVIKTSKDNLPPEKENKRRRIAREKVERLTRIRDQLHDDLARKMIEFPEVAASGFTALLAAAEARGDDIGQEFVDLAVKSLRPAKKKSGGIPGRGYSTRHYSYSSYYGSEEDTVEKRSPEDFLPRYFGLLKSDEATQLESITKQLDEWQATDKAAYIRSVYRLYSSTPDQFVNAANEHLKAAKALKRRNPYLLEQAISKIVEVWVDRNAPVDIEGLVLNFVEQNSSSSASMASYGPWESFFLSEYLAKLIETEGGTRGREFLASYRKLTIGSEEDQLKLIKQFNEKNRRSNSKQLRAFVRYGEMLEGQFENPKTMFIAIEEASRMQMAAFFPMRLRPSPRPTVVVVLPSPAGVGLIAVTRIRWPS